MGDVSLQGNHNQNLNAVEMKDGARPAVLPTDEKAPLQPNQTFYIVPHTGFTKVIQVLDLTPQIKERIPYNGFTDAYKEAVKELAKNSPPEPTYTITRQNWVASRMIVTSASGAELAAWKAPHWSPGTTTLTFPRNSPHCSHTIEMKPVGFWHRSEHFVKDSVTYTWEMESKLTSSAFTLLKIIGQKKVEVARYAQSFGFTTGGTLILDSREVDELVVVLTCAAMLKKKRLRDQEYANSGAGH
ncbi:hypothetical protein W97_08044 [Coniosporium apollinis CBS 100218]|uniref:Uncharacterized protein n=1 Tax=Coniosporium apollinis (strain CBS 100218) TaxID=1168221 RepID=R7Z4D2_CONA1|nr:uncharacterized protein W97_08044 [Coniosporium apollinis CBS 100218]EON68786.1 hypothetical protein W97_08044 [Coniosporium apollinis CBS 100218]